MERTKYLLTVLAFCSFTLLWGESNPAIYKGFINGNMASWKSTIDSIDALKSKSNKQLLELINYQYGFIGFSLGKKNNDQAAKYLKAAKANLKHLESEKYELSTLYAYKAAFVGFDIGLSPIKAPFIGPNCMEYAQKSLKLDPSNALAILQVGNVSYYAPKVFGGSKSEAIKHYTHALKIMEGRHELRTRNWNYLNLLAVLIIAHMEIEQNETARRYCVKALAVEPNFHWVKNNLYPKVLKKLNQ